MADNDGGPDKGFDFQPPGFKLPEDMPEPKPPEPEEGVDIPETLPSRSKLQWTLVFFAVVFATAALVTAVRRNPRLFALGSKTGSKAVLRTVQTPDPRSSEAGAGASSSSKAPGASVSGQTQYPKEVVELEARMVDHLKKNPNDTKMMANLVNLYVETRRFEQAMQVLDRIRAVDPQYPRLYTTVAYISELGGNDQQAAQFYSYAMQHPKEKGDVVVYERFGALLIRNGNLADAEKVLMNGYKIKPDSPPLLFSLATLNNQAKRYAKAEGYFKTLLHTGDIDKQGGARAGECYYGLAYAEVMQKKYRASLPHLKKALAYAPNAPQVYGLLAKTFKALGKKREAAQAEARAEELTAAIAQASGQANAPGNP